MIIEEFPYEAYVELEGNPHFMGRIVVNQLKSSYNAEIDIVHKETHKIYQHVDILFGESGPKEALDSAYQKLAKYVQGEV